MCFKNYFLFAAFISFLLCLPAHGQETFPVGPVSETEFEQRLVLAREINQHQPVGDRVREILEVMSENLILTDLEEEQFIISIYNNMDIADLEELSVESMAEIFTLPELEAMLAYYSQVESDVIKEKSGLYRQQIDPAISASIQRTLLRLQALPNPVIPGRAATPQVVPVE